MTRITPTGASDTTKAENPMSRRIATTAVGLLVSLALGGVATVQADHPSCLEANFPCGPTMPLSGGPNDAYAECDVLITVCAGAAAVALSGCVAGKTEFAGTGDGGEFLWYDLHVDVEAEATTTACMSIATAQAITAKTQLPAVLDNWASAHTNNNEKKCDPTTDNMFKKIVCGPTGTTWWTSTVRCISADARGSANWKSPPEIPAPLPGFGLAGSVQANAVAYSEYCDVIFPDRAKIYSEGLPVIPGTNLVPFADLSERVRQEIVTTLLGGFLQELDDHASYWATSDDAPARELLDSIHLGMRDEITRAVTSFSGDILVPDSSPPES